MVAHRATLIIVLEVQTCFLEHQLFYLTLIPQIQKKSFALNNFFPNFSLCSKNVMLLIYQPPVHICRTFVNAMWTGGRYISNPPYTKKGELASRLSFGVQKTGTKTVEVWQFDKMSC